MSIKQKDLEGIIEKLEDGEYTNYFYLPDFDKESGGMQNAYNHVRAMNRNGFKAVVVHQKEGFCPEWLKDYYETNEDGTIKDVPMVYLDSGNMPISMEDTFFIPEGFPQVMENLQKQNAPCKRIVFCQNWYYVLNALKPGEFWDSYGISDCMSITQSQTDYLKMIMPFLNIKTVVGQIDHSTYHKPVLKTDKQLEVAFIPSRDGGVKAHNIIKTFYAMFPHFRFVPFKEIKGLARDDYAKTLTDAAFYVHFDEFSSWGTAPIEAFLSGCLVAGWDGVGGREYMTVDNMWIVPNGDVMRLALAIGNMIETYVMDNVKPETWDAMEKVTMMYTEEEERDSIIRVHTEYREERIEEMNKLIEFVKVHEAKKEEEEGESNE